MDRAFSFLLGVVTGAIGVIALQKLLGEQEESFDALGDNIEKQLEILERETKKTATAS